MVKVVVKADPKVLKEAVKVDVRSNYLAHHGVKGMKWGVRRAKKSSSSSKSKRSILDDIKVGLKAGIAANGGGKEVAKGLAVGLGAGALTIGTMSAAHIAGTKATAAGSKFISSAMKGTDQYSSIKNVSKVVRMNIRNNARGVRYL